LYRHVGGLFALENAAGVDTCLPPSIKKVRSIAYQPAGLGKLAERIERWHSMAGRQRDDLSGASKKKTVAAHQERASPLLNNIRKGRLDLAWPTCVHEQQAHPKSMRCNLHLSRFGLGKNRIGRVPEVSDQRGRRHQFAQQLKALSGSFSQQEVYAGEISARVVAIVGSMPLGSEAIRQRVKRSVDACWTPIAPIFIMCFSFGSESDGRH
jgi:hypothetical protein